MPAVMCALENGRDKTSVGGTAGGCTFGVMVWPNPESIYHKHLTPAFRREQRLVIDRWQTLHYPQCREKSNGGEM